MKTSHVLIVLVCLGVLAAVFFPTAEDIHQIEIYDHIEIERGGPERGEYLCLTIHVPDSLDNNDVDKAVQAYLHSWLEKNPRKQLQQRLINHRLGKKANYRMYEDRYIIKPS